MLPRPLAAIAPNTFEFETVPLVKPTGFREYDARWWFGGPGSDIAPELNLLGVTALGLGLGTFLKERGVAPDIVTAHDFRSYSSAVKTALINGLMASGCRVHDIGLALSPMAYFAQFELSVPSVAMVTASHNENGWTGVKMGCAPPTTFGPEDMGRLKEIVLGGTFRCCEGGELHNVEGFAERYVAALTDRAPLTRRLKAVVATGNGTAGAFAPRILETMGCAVVPLHTDLDHSFPNYNPNPEDLAMLHDVAAAVTASGADVGFAFDGDGDRCGVVDNRGREIFSDKVGVLLARDFAAQHPDARFVVDVKSTGLYATDPVLQERGATTDYWKTGHSYMKRRVSELGAMAGFEKSGHFFFGPPLGRGYDDAMLAALAVCDLLDSHPDQMLADLYDDLPETWASPTLSAECADEVKYEVAHRVKGRIERMVAAGETLAGQAIVDVNTVNGVRFTVEDGSWGLVRASSNKPELVVVAESPVSQARMRTVFEHVDRVLRENAEVGAYNQEM